MIGLSAFLYLCHATSIVSALLLPPENIRLFSENFQHVLTWDDPNHVSPIYYRVEYQARNNGYVAAGACANITAHSCDLTKDFTDLMGDYRVLVKIFAHQNVSEAYSRKKFNPLQHTAIGPPIVDVVPCDRCIRVSIQPPVSYLWSDKEKRNVTMLSDSVYPLMSYIISLVHSTGNSTTAGYLDTENTTVLSDLLPQSNYCVSVHVESGNSRSSIPSALKCVITKSNDANDWTLVIIVCTVFAVLLFVGLLLLFFSLDRAGYIFMGTNFAPKVLKSFSASESVFSVSPEAMRPICVVPVEIIDRRSHLEEKQGTDEHCGEGYCGRKHLLSSAPSDTTSSGHLPSGTSSSEDSSGQASGSSAEREVAGEFLTGLDVVVLAEASCSPGTHLPVNDSSNKTPNLLFNNNGDFNINLNSVSIADPEEVWTGFRMEEAPEVLISAQRTAMALDVDHWELLPQDISMGEGRTSPFQYDVSSEEEEVPDNNDSEEPTTGAYMRR